MSKEPREIVSIEVEFQDSEKQSECEKDFTFERIEDDYTENYFSFEALKDALSNPK